MVTVQRICAWHPLYWPDELPPLLGTYEDAEGGTSHGCCDRCFVRALEEVADSRVRRGCLGKRSYPCRHAARVALRRQFAPRTGVRVYRCWYSRPRHYHLGHELPATIVAQPIADAV